MNHVRLPQNAGAGGIGTLGAFLYALSLEEMDTMTPFRREVVANMEGRGLFSPA
jgi:hypothetical protein